MDPLVDCVDPWGRRIVLTEGQWSDHVVEGHAELAGLASAVVAVLTNPDLLAQDIDHPDRRRFYRRGVLPAPRTTLYLKVSVAFTTDAVGSTDRGFVITAHPAKRPKKGAPPLWQR